MKMLTMSQAIFRRRLLRINVLTGLLIFIAAFGLNVFGNYNNLDELKAADTLFNFVAIGGLLYAAVSWIYCVMSKPFWFPGTDKHASDDGS